VGITMLANLAGAGLLSLPFTLKRAGIIPGAIALVSVCFANACSALLLARCAELAGGGGRAAGYKDVAVAALGPRAGGAVAATLAVYTLGSCVSFAVLLGDFLPELFDAALDGACGGGGGGGGRCAAARALLSRAPVSVALAGGAFLYPLALLRNLDGLRFTSAASAVCTVYTCALLLALCAAGPRAPAAELNVRGGGAGLFIALPILLVAFTMHYNVPRLFAEMKGDAAGGKLRRFGVAVAGAFCAALTIYASGALGGYLLIGAATKGDILENFAAGDAPIIVARVALSVVVTACYPLAFNAMRAAVTSLLPARCARRLAAPADARTHASDDDEEVAGRAATGRAPLLDDGARQAPAPAPGAAARRGCAAAAAADWPHAALTAGLVALSLGVAMLVPNIATVLSYKGALGGSLIVVIFPAWMHWALVLRRAASPRKLLDGGGGGRGGADDDDDSAALPDLAWRWRDVFATRHGLFAVAATAVGLALMVSGTLAAAGAI
jgi:amino acid permease